MLETVMQIVLVVLVISQFITFFRLWRGPTLPDRIVAMEDGRIVESAVSAAA